METKPTFIDGLIVIKPQVYKDKRGYFFESFNLKSFQKHFGDIDFVQDNESKSTYGVLRGLHFQKPPHAQAKLVRCIQGKVLDVAVDIRINSPTFGKHFSIILSEENKKQLFIPRGFAHGYVVLTKTATFAYKVDAFYEPSHDSGIIWNDTKLSIDWCIEAKNVIISPKDNQLKPISQTDLDFF